MVTRPRSLISAMLFCAALGGSLAATANQQSARPSAASAPDVTTLGPQVGDKVPDFTLPDQHGRPRSLASLMGEKGLVLVFYRSADW
jgi:cytochrome oxidase Cu insertion factor (SCO1/SenC/PrrC family)